MESVEKQKKNNLEEMELKSPQQINNEIASAEASEKKKKKKGRDKSSENMSD
jgi:hypothetical protein